MTTITTVLTFYFSLHAVHGCPLIRGPNINGYVAFPFLAGGGISDDLCSRGLRVVTVVFTVLIVIA